MRGAWSQNKTRHHRQASPRAPAEVDDAVHLRSRDVGQHLAAIGEGQGDRVTGDVTEPEHDRRSVRRSQSMRGRRLRRAVALPSSTNCYVSPELFPRLARTAIAIAPIAIATAKVVANKTQTIPIPTDRSNVVFYIQPTKVDLYLSPSDPALF